MVHTILLSTIYEVAFKKYFFHPFFSFHVDWRKQAERGTRVTLFGTTK